MTNDPTHRLHSRKYELEMNTGEQCGRESFPRRGWTRRNWTFPIDECNRQAVATEFVLIVI